MDGKEARDVFRLAFGSSACEAKPSLSRTSPHNNIINIYLHLWCDGLIIILNKYLYIIMIETYNLVAGKCLFLKNH